MKKFTFLFLIAFSVSLQAQNAFYQYLDKNRVKAQISKLNDRFWSNFSGGAPRYEVPKGSGRNAQFINSIWIGGLDNTNQLHLCANTYKQRGTDYFNGPVNITNQTSFTPSVVSRYNRVWKVDCNDINAFVNAYNSGATLPGANTYTVPDALANYPAVEMTSYMYPMEDFFDANNDGLYRPAIDGDYPIIKGQQQILSIYNDLQSTHGESHALPLGVEIHEKSYAFYEPNIADSMKVINFTTFYEYTVYNRSNNDYHDVYVTDFADVDLGYFLDDYVGTDSVNQFVYSYNGNDNDPNGGAVYGYGQKPPVASHAMLSDCPSCLTDGIDNDNDGVFDEAGEKFIINHVTYYFDPFTGVPLAVTAPTVAAPYEYYNYMTGRWRDSTLFQYGGDAHNPTGSTPSDYLFTGNPQNGTGWTEATAGMAPGDRRFFMSSGPFILKAKQSFVFSYAIVFSWDSINNVNTITQFNTRVQNDIRHARYYEQTHRTPQCRPGVATGIKSQESNPMTFMAYPNPVSNQLEIALDRNATGAVITLKDMMGRELKKTAISQGYRSQMDVSQLDAGVYLLEVNFENHSVTQKIIKN